eukprot:jgi/Bigna1/134088/aug1.23_g8796
MFGDSTSNDGKSKLQQQENQESNKAPALNAKSPSSALSSPSSSAWEDDDHDDLEGGTDGGVAFMDIKLKTLLSTYELAYLKVVIARLNHPEERCKEVLLPLLSTSFVPDGGRIDIKTMFASVSSGRYPTDADADLFVNTLNSTIANVRVSSEELIVQVANRMKQAINLLLANAEDQVELKAIEGRPIPRKNHQIYKCLGIVEKGVDRILVEYGHFDEQEALAAAAAEEEEEEVKKKEDPKQQQQHRTQTTQIAKKEGGGGGGGGGVRPSSGSKKHNNHLLPVKAIELLRQAQVANRAL